MVKFIMVHRKNTTRDHDEVSINPELVKRVNKIGEDDYELVQVGDEPPYIVIDKEDYAKLMKVSKK